MEVMGGGAVVARAGLQDPELAVPDVDEARDGDAGAVEEAGVLEGSRLFEGDVEVVFGVGDLLCWEEVSGDVG